MAKKKADRYRGPDGLTAREREFVPAYVQTLLETGGVGNATLACRRIGVTPKQATNAGHALMKSPRVQSAIAAHGDMLAKKYDVTSERILFELSKLAYNGMSKFARKTEEGDLYFDFSAATPDELDAITELTVDEYMDGKGENAREVKRVRFKLERRGALELLGKHKKLFSEGIFEADNSPESKSDAELLKIINQRKEERK
jgi:phage terminase small subunit